jgi:hypothetical protein
MNEIKEKLNKYSMFIDKETPHFQDASSSQLDLSMQSQSKSQEVGWEYSSATEHLPSMCEALSLIPITSSSKTQNSSKLFCIH